MATFQAQRTSPTGRSETSAWTLILECWTAAIKCNGTGVDTALSKDDLCREGFFLGRVTLSRCRGNLPPRCLRQTGIKREGIRIYFAPPRIYLFHINYL